MPSCSCPPARDCPVHQCEPCLGMTFRWGGNNFGTGSPFGICPDCGGTGVERKEAQGGRG